MMLRKTLATLVVAVGSLAPLARSATYNITDDTYADSYHYTDPTTSLTADYRRRSFGQAPTVKAVSNNGSGSQYPDSFSLVHAFLTLPSDVWATLGTANAASATLTYAVQNNQLGAVPADVRRIEVIPLTHAFTAGTGGTSVQNSFTLNTDAAPVGLDWLTYDGTHAWANPNGGGDYDSAATPALSTAATVNGNPSLQWDLSSLLNNPTTRAEIKAYGLMLRVTNENSNTGNIFASLKSGDNSIKPTIAIAAVPEPATLAALAAGLLVARRRRRII